MVVKCTLFLYLASYIVVCNNRLLVQVTISPLVCVHHKTNNNNSLGPKRHCHLAARSAHARVNCYARIVIVIRRFLLAQNHSMKFETRSGCKLLSISPLRRKRIFGSLSLRNRSFGAVARIRLDTMSGPIGKLIGPAKTRLQRYVEEASSLP